MLVYFLVFSAASAQDRGTDIEDVSLESLLRQKVSAASKHEQSSHQAPASVTVIGAEEIKRFGYTNVAEVLDAVHGFYINNDLKTHSIGVRGFGRPSDNNSRMLVLVDGHPMNESATNWAFLDMRLGVDINLIDRIEIVRGPGSALYGTGAMMAVVNVVTKKADALDGVRVSGMAGSYGLREGHVSIAKSLKNDNGIIAAATWGASEGHDIYFEDLDFEHLNFGVAEQQDWKDYRALMLGGTVGPFNVRGRHVSHHNGDPTGTILTTFNHNAAQQRTGIGVLEALFRHAPTSSTLLSLGAHLNQAAQEKTLPIRYGEEVVVTDDRGESIWTGLVGDLRWDPSPVHRIVTGGELKTAFIDYLRWTPEGNIDESDYRFSQAAAFLQNEYSPSRKLTATTGIRFDYYSQSGGAVSPRFALVYNPFRTTTVKALYGHAFRSPSVVELHWEQLEHNFIGNPDLVPERIRTLEFVWEQTLSDRIASTVSIYQYAMSDLIEITYTASDRKIRFENRGQVNALGTEFALRGRTDWGILGYGSYSYQRARHVPSGEPLVSSPEHLLKGGLSYLIRDRTSTGAEMRYESCRYTVFGTRTDPYWLVDLVARTSELLGGHIEVIARIRNVLNTEYDLPGSPEHRQLALTQHGRRFIVELRYQF